MATDQKQIDELVDAARRFSYKAALMALKYAQLEKGARTVIRHADECERLQFVEGSLGKVIKHERLARQGYHRVRHQFEALGGVK